MASDLQAAERHVDIRAARMVLVVAVGVFVVQCWFFTGAQLMWHEEVSVHPSAPSGYVIVSDGVARVVDVCGGDSWLAFTPQRPYLVLCAAGLAWPVLVTPYIGGLHYWPLQVLRPLHRGDPVALRRTALVIGVLALVVLFMLLAPLGGPLRAAAAVSVAAVLPASVMAHSLLVLYEVVPSLLIGCAALVVVRRPGPNGPLSPRRGVAVGTIVGLAVLANVKAAVVGLPLFTFALCSSPVLRQPSQRAWVIAGVAAAVLASPMAIAALADPQHAFGHEVGRRLTIAGSRLAPHLLASEVFNAVLFAADVAFFLDIAAGGSGGLWPVTLLIPGLAFVYTTIELVRALRGKPHDRIAAACGAIQVFYVVFVWLAYQQTPAANYAPILYVQAVSIGCALVAVGSRLRSRRPILVLTAAGSITLVALVVNTYRRGDPREFQTTSINLAAVRALGVHLQRTQEGPIVVTSYNLAGLPDALTGTPSLRVDQALEGCARDPDPEACERDVLIATIQAIPEAHFLVPLRTSVVDKPPARRVMTTIENAAHALRARVREEARFETARGVPVLGLVVVDRESARTADAILP